MVQRKPLPNMRSGFGSAALAGRIYTFGGNRPKDLSSDVDLYDVRTDTWTVKSGSLGAPRKWVGTVVFRNSIWLLGGVSAGSDDPVATVEVFEPSR